MLKELIAVKKAHNKPVLAFLNSLPVKYIVKTVNNDGTTDEALKDKSVSGKNNSQNFIYK